MFETTIDRPTGASLPLSFTLHSSLRPCPDGECLLDTLLSIIDSIQSGSGRLLRLDPSPLELSTPSRLSDKEI